MFDVKGKVPGFGCKVLCQVTELVVKLITVYQGGVKLQVSRSGWVLGVRC